MTQPALSIAKSPKSVDFAKNQIGFLVNRTRSRMGRFYFLFTEAPPIGSYIEFMFADKLLHFDVVAAADSSGTQLTSTIDTSIILADLNKNTVFSNAWQCYNSTPPILGFYEKDELAFYSIEIICTENAFRYYYVDQGKYSDPQKLVSELFAKQAGNADFISQGYSFHFIDYNGVSKINVSDKLANGFKPYTPVVGASVVDEILQTEYYLKIWEYYQGSSNMFQNIQTTSNYKAINGRLLLKEFVSFSWPTPFYILSNAPEWCETWEDSHQEFTVLITGDITTFDVSVKMYFDDETEETSAIETVACSQWKSYYIPAGYSQLNVSGKTPSGKYCYRYEVVITNGSNSISKSFIVRPRPEFGRAIRFLNAKGGYDTVSVNAYLSLKKNVSITVSEKSTEIFSTDSESVMSVVSNSTEEFEAEITGLTKPEVEQIKEIIDSQFVYIDNDGAFERMILSTKDVDLWSDKEDLTNVKLSFRYA